MKSSTFIHMGEVTPQSTIGGKIVITGIGKYEEDEFMLSLLNEQNLWSSVILATDDEEVAKKKFLSRTARYSGLLNILGIYFCRSSTKAYVYRPILCNSEH